eukprot:364809-Chlamydomonas_euryale.AAC.27
MLPCLRSHTLQSLRCAPTRCSHYVAHPHVAVTTLRTHTLQLLCGRLPAGAALRQPAWPVCVCAVTDRCVAQEVWGRGCERLCVGKKRASQPQNALVHDKFHVDVDGHDRWMEGCMASVWEVGG